MQFPKPEEQIKYLIDKAIESLLDNPTWTLCLEMDCPQKIIKDGCTGCIGNLKMVNLLEVNSNIETKEHMLEAITVINLLD